MKIEVGESLLLSWLRHVKECQLTQLNWKASTKWQLHNEDVLQRIMQATGDWYLEKTDVSLYKKTSSLRQLLGQAEVDVIGVSFSESGTQVYAVDVAFHEGGLLYGSGKDDTINIVIKKIIRTAMCIYGYFGAVNPNIVFAAPKIPKEVFKQINILLTGINEVLKNEGLQCDIRIIGNDDFNELILKPVLSLAHDVADTSELFMRSIQLYNLFVGASQTTKEKKSLPVKTDAAYLPIPIVGDLGEGITEMKIGVLARTALRNDLESGNIAEEEIEKFQTLEYSKKIFKIGFPLLKTTRIDDKDRVRYYKDALSINGKTFFLCSLWYEENRPFLLAWLEANQKIN